MSELSRRFGAPRGDSAGSLRRIHSHPFRTTVLAVVALACIAHGQTTAPSDGKLDFGAEGLVFPPATIVNAHTARTAQLLGDAYRRKEPLEWKRVRYVADLGQTAHSAAAPYVTDAMKDESPAVRAEAARSAGMIADAPASLREAVEKLLDDADANVRREAVLSAAALAQAHDAKTAAIELGLADKEPAVIAAAIERAWTAEHAQQVAQELPSLPKPLHAHAADALARLKATDHAQVLLPLFAGDVVQRAAATRAFGEIGKPGTFAPALKLLDDPHPTVRREAVTAIGKLDPDVVRKLLAIKLLGDADPTVRQAVAGVLTPIPTVEAMAAIAAQLNDDYAPLHAAARRALVHPANDAVRQSTITLAAEMLTHANPRRREDGSYVLGRLRSAQAMEQHLDLLRWDLSAQNKTDWRLVAQAAESLGFIGDPRATTQLMELVQAVPDALAKVPIERQLPVGQAMGSAMAALGRIGHRPALNEAIRVITTDPVAPGMPGDLRAASAWVIGALGEAGAVPSGVDFLQIYGSIDEAAGTKFEALKAVGNLRYAPLAKRLKSIGETDLTPELRWIAHWSYQRAANTTEPYTPPADLRQPPVTISDLPRLSRLAQRSSGRLLPI